MGGSAADAKSIDTDHLFAPAEDILQITATIHVRKPGRFSSACTRVRCFDQGVDAIA